MDKRTFIKSVILGTTGVFTIGINSVLHAKKTSKKWDGLFRLPELPYSYDALEPFFDAQTMELHYTQYHAGYTDKLNLAVSEAGLTGLTAVELLKNASRYPVSVGNNAGGYLNHKIFWSVLSPASNSQPSNELSTAIEKEFGSMAGFKSSFNQAAKSVFGSGWVWLIIDKNRKLKVTTTLNQDNPLMDNCHDKGYPILCLDVWEHAYYMKNQNRRDEYTDSFWNVVNWGVVSKGYGSALKNENF